MISDFAPELRNGSFRTAPGTSPTLVQSACGGTDGKLVDCRLLWSAKWFTPRSASLVVSVNFASTIFSSPVDVVVISSRGGGTSSGLVKKVAFQFCGTSIV